MTGAISKGRRLRNVTQSAKALETDLKPIVYFEALAVSAAQNVASFVISASPMKRS
jgi:hypothetical protein